MSFEFEQIGPGGRNEKKSAFTLLYVHIECVRKKKQEEEEEGQQGGDRRRDLSKKVRKFLLSLSLFLSLSILIPGHTHIHIHSQAHFEEKSDESRHMYVRGHIYSTTTYMYTLALVQERHIIRSGLTEPIGSTYRTAKSYITTKANIKTKVSQGGYFCEGFSRLIHGCRMSLGLIFLLLISRSQMISRFPLYFIVVLVLGF